MTQPQWQSCPNCQQSVPGDAAVCGFCGHRLKASTAEQPTLAQPVAPPPVGATPRSDTSIERSLEPARLYLSTSRVLGTIGAVLVILSPVLPWLTASFTRSHNGFDIAWTDLIPGDTFPGGGRTLQSIGLAILIVGLVALWWALTAKPTWLGWIAGVAAFAIAVGVAIQVVRTIGGDFQGSFEILDIGLYTALIGGILLIGGSFSRERL